MDIKNFLPLIMSGNKNAEKIMPLIKALNARQKTDSSAKNSGDARLGNDNPFSFNLDGEGNSVATEAIKNMLSSATQKQRLSGITPVLGVVNDDILGKMIKYLNSSR